MNLEVYNSPDAPTHSHHGAHVKKGCSIRKMKHSNTCAHLIASYHLILRARVRRFVVFSNSNFAAFENYFVTFISSWHFV